MSLDKGYRYVGWIKRTMNNRSLDKGHEIVGMEKKP